MASKIHLQRAKLEDFEKSCFPSTQYRVPLASLMEHPSERGPEVVIFHNPCTTLVGSFPQKKF